MVGVLAVEQQPAATIGPSVPMVGMNPSSTSTPPDVPLTPTANTSQQLTLDNIDTPVDLDINNKHELTNDIIKLDDENGTKFATQDIDDIDRRGWGRRTHHYDSSHYI